MGLCGSEDTIEANGEKGDKAENGEKAEKAEKAENGEKGDKAAPLLEILEGGPITFRDLLFKRLCASHKAKTGSLSPPYASALLTKTPSRK